MKTLHINVGEPLLQFDSYQQWVNRARTWFEGLGKGSYEYICVDVSGRVCTCGKQFMRARDENTYPITVYAIEEAPHENVEEKQASA